MLTRHLVHLGVGVTEDFKDAALDGAFNELWANNGDAISRQYAGTSALKGDFVRTGKRDWRGVVNDATNSVGRLWQNTIADFCERPLFSSLFGKAEHRDSQAGLHRLVSMSLGARPTEADRMQRPRRQPCRLCRVPRESDRDRPWRSASRPYPTWTELTDAVQILRLGRIRAVASSSSSPARSGLR